MWSTTRASTPGMHQEACVDTRQIARCTGSLRMLAWTWSRENDGAAPWIITPAQSDAARNIKVLLESVGLQSPTIFFYLILAASCPENFPRKLRETNLGPSFDYRPKWHRFLGLGISRFPSQCFCGRIFSRASLQNYIPHPLVVRCRRFGGRARPQHPCLAWLLVACSLST